MNDLICFVKINFKRKFKINLNNGTHSYLVQFACCFWYKIYCCELIFIQLTGAVFITLIHSDITLINKSG
jgi:hypothetical protein